MSKVKIQNSKQKVADLLLRIGSVNISFKKQFTLTSGKKSPVYVIINEMAKQIRKKYKKTVLLAGGETAGIPYSSFLCQKLKLPMIYVRKQPKGFGKGKLIEGNFKSKSSSILIEDMATDGGSKIHFIQSMRKSKLIVKDIFVIFFYDIYPSAKKNIKKMKVNLNYLTSWNEILEVSPNYISNSDQIKLKEYLISIANGK
jgi:orotate phosphoribosyltransferase